MSKDHKRRPPVFTPAEEPVITPLTEVMRDFPSDQELEPTQEAGVEDVEEPHTPEPEAVGAENVLRNGWRVIGLEQQTGKTYIVGNTLEEEGKLAFWRKTRVLSHYKWVLNGKWTDPLTRAEILPQPVYYKENV